MVLVGYDDSQNAFKLINSWGTEWGEEGYAWVDYDYFIDEFAHPGLAFVMLEEEVESSCKHLTPWVVSDTPIDGERKRKVQFDIHNESNTKISQEDNFKVLFMYVNDKNAHDFGLLYRSDLITNDALAPNKHLNGSFEYELPLLLRLAVHDVPTTCKLHDRYLIAF